MDSTAYTPGSFSAVRRFRSKSPDKLFIEQFLEPERNTIVFVRATGIGVPGARMAGRPQYLMS